MESKGTDDTLHVQCAGWSESVYFVHVWRHFSLSFMNHFHNFAQDGSVPAVKLKCQTLSLLIQVFYFNKKFHQKAHGKLLWFKLMSTSKINVKLTPLKDAFIEVWLQVLHHFSKSDSEPFSFRIKLVLISVDTKLYLLLPFSPKYNVILCGRNDIPIWQWSD